MPTQPTATRHSPRGPLHAWRPNAGDIVLFGAVLNLSYAALLIWALTYPETRVGLSVAGWVRIARNILQPAYALAGEKVCGGEAAGAAVALAWGFYVHLLAINLAVVGGLFAASRPLWFEWAHRLDEEVRWREALSSEVGDEADVADEAYGTLMWGAIAALWWLILENDLFESAKHCAAFRPWQILRVPLLATFAHGLASLTAAFWAARKS